MQKYIISRLWLLLFSLAWVQPSAVHQRPRGGKSLRDSSLSDQTGSLIAQKCGSGFYREWNGPRRGQCVPCSCNGLSDQCDELTGKCVNCQFHSAGDHCERCQEGYHGDAAQKNCRSCPCPFTWNNRALACLVVSSGVVECLCKRGYAGSRCERCAVGYCGDPAAQGGSCKPCGCSTGADGNICHSLTAESISPSNKSSDDHFHTLKCCTEALLLRLRANEGDLRGLTHFSASVSTQSHPQGSVSDAEGVVKRYSSARRHLELKTKQLQEDVITIKDDLDQLTQQALQLSSRVDKTLESCKAPKTKAKILLGHAEFVLGSLRDLIKPPSQAADAIMLNGRDKATVMEEAHRLMEEMSRRVCVDATTRGRTRGKRMMAKKLEDALTKMAAVRPNQQALNQTADSLMASQAHLGHMHDLLSGAKAAVRRARHIHLKNASTLRHLRHSHNLTKTETQSLRAVTEKTRRHLLSNITTIFIKLQDAKHGFEKDAALLDGAKQQLQKRNNNIYRVVAKMQIISKAEDHARKLGKLATDMQKMLSTASNTKLSSEPNTLHIITTDMADAAMAAHQSDMAADEALKDVMRGVVLLKTKALSENSTHLWTTANRTQDDFRKLSQSLNTHKDGMKRRKDKGESMGFDISRVSDEIKSLKRDATDVLIKSAKRQASATNDIVNDVTRRLTNMRQEMDRLTLNNSVLALNNILSDAQRAVRSMDWTFPVVRDKIAQVEALGKTAAANGNVTENIIRIKDLVQDTWSYLNRTSRPAEDITLGHPGSHTQIAHTPTDVSRQLQMLKQTEDQTDGECGRQRVPRRGYELSQGDSWLAYKLPQQDLNYRPHFSLDVKTKSSAGLLLFVEGTGPVPLLALYVTNGKIKMSLGPSRAIHHKLKTNDGHWHRVECSVERTTFHLLVDGIRVTDGHLPNEEGSSLNFHGHVYLGGHPGTTKGPNILLRSIMGCVRDFRMNDQLVGKPEGARGVSPCSDGLKETGVYFGGGHVVLDTPFAIGAHFALTFEVRPRHLTGLLFHARGHGTGLDVFLINNTVGVTVNDGGDSVGATLTRRNLCDGNFHVITVSKGQKDLTLMVDAMSEKKAASFASVHSSMTRALLHIGGAADSSGGPVTSPFMGCLRNAIINGRRIEFNTRAVKVLGPVDVKACPAY